MDYKELLEKYNLLLSENRRLIEENDRLNAQLEIAGRNPDENRIKRPTTEKSIQDDETSDSALFSAVNNRVETIFQLEGAKPSELRICISKLLIALIYKGML